MNVVRVRFFSVLREQCGVEETSVELEPTATGKDLLDRLEERFPLLRAYRPSIRLAVNYEYVPDTTGLRDGDEAALITPVSGG